MLITTFANKCLMKKLKKNYQCQYLKKPAFLQATLSLKIAELQLFKEEKGENPILLLDDVLSELDDTRKLNLLRAVKDIQTIITCTKFNYKPAGEYKIFNIINGTVQE